MSAERPREKRENLSPLSTNGHPENGKIASLARLINGGVDEDTLLELYYAETDHELLTHDEEIELFKTIEAGRKAGEKLDKNGRKGKNDIISLVSALEVGKFAEEKVIESNLKLVVSVATKYFHFNNGSVPLLDLIQEGNIGLMKAVEKYNWRTGNRFSTYATWWIRADVTRYIINTDRTIRIPYHTRNEIKRMQRQMVVMTQELGRKPTEEELSSRLDTDVDSIKFLQEKIQPILSLDMQISTDEDQIETFSDIIKDEKSDFTTIVSAKKFLKETVQEAIRSSHLTPREERVLILRFGLNGNKPLSFKEIGKKMGLSFETIRLIEAPALEKLRNNPSLKEQTGYITSED